jgi:hypothetical protein
MGHHLNPSQDESQLLPQHFTIRGKPRCWLRPADLAQLPEFYGVWFAPGFLPKTASTEGIEELKKRFRLALREHKEIQRKGEEEILVRKVEQRRYFEEYKAIIMNVAKERLLLQEFNEKFPYYEDVSMYD